jgi:membrane protease YdiL (CAAX protease family)
MFPDDLGRPSLTLSESLWKIALFTVTVPLEELIFRGYIQRSMARMVPRLVAVTAAAFVFTLFHIQRYAADGFQGVTLLLPLAVVFALGVATGHVYTRINDLAAAVALHFIYNLVVVLGGLLDG